MFKRVTVVWWTENLGLSASSMIFSKHDIFRGANTGNRGMTSKELLNVTRIRMIVGMCGELASPVCGGTRGIGG